MNTAPLRYAGFWFRLGAILVDVVITMPVALLTLWGESRYRLFSLYCLLPTNLFRLFYNVYLVRRLGGTPGKLLVGIRIRKLDGQPVGYREAILRYFPEFVLDLSLSIAMVIPLFQITDAKYLSLSFRERTSYIIQHTPAWNAPVQIINKVWFWGELVVLLTNRKKRALHDFIAGTVVVRASSSTATEPTMAAPSVST
jgi:uncharacterized RDD family membrane protein YckC